MQSPCCRRLAEAREGIGRSRRPDHAPRVNRRLEHALQSTLRSGPAFRFVAVFGSQATGRAGPNSDIDLAWLPADPAIPLAQELALQAVDFARIWQELPEGLAAFDGFAQEVARHLGGADG